MQRALPFLLCSVLLTACNRPNDFTVVCPSGKLPPCDVPVITSFTATPSSILAGQSSTLAWQVTGTDAVAIDQGVGIVTGTSVSVTPAATTVYTLTASNGSGSSTAQTTVSVTPPVACTTLGYTGSEVWFQGGPDSISLAMGDLNDDGRTDLAVISSYGYSTVLLGKGDGTFTTAPDLDTGTRPSWVAIADLDSDGKLDLAVANTGANNVSVFLGKGDGTFSAKVDYPTATAPLSLAVADVNRDGHPDIVAACSTGKAVSVLLNKHDGTFAAKVDYPMPTDANSIAVADFNGDGYPDLAVALSQRTRVMWNDQNGAFPSATDIPVGADIPTPAAVAVGDLNGDGRPDIVVADFELTIVNVLLNSGGAFPAAVDYVITGAASIAVGDVNGDHVPDILGTAGFSPTLSVLLGKGDGTFRAPTDFATCSGPYVIAIGELNGGGLPDIATGCTDGPEAWLLLDTCPR